jgi:DNA adenine methylase
MDASVKIEKPFPTYNGGKESDGTYQKIINIMPPHYMYVEPFVGNGAIFRRKKRSERTMLNDLDWRVTEKWKAILWADLNIWVSNSDVFDLIKMLADTEFMPGQKGLIYLDPPYPFETRSSKRNLYKHEFTAQDHIRLLADAGSLKNFMIIISSYPNDLYNEALKDWNCFEFESSTRHGMKTEKVWFNYDYPTELHDYSYLGDNFRERERIKGIIHRNVSKINKMPPVMKNYLFQELKMNFNDNI